MPPLETMDRYQDAVLWVYTGRSDRKGNPIVSAPVQLKVQWDDVEKTIRRSYDNIISVVAEVMVDRDIPVHSIMIKGKLNDWGELGTGSTTGVMANMELLEVVKFTNTPSINNRNHERTVSLSRYKKTLPTLEA